MIKRYGYKDGKRGLEAEYETIAGVLKVKIHGADHAIDYWDCLMAWPRKRCCLGKFHRVWFKMAEGLAKELNKEIEAESPQRVEIIAHSMGGAVAPIAGVLIASHLYTVEIQSFNAPKFGDLEAAMLVDSTVGLIARYDRGDVVRLLPLFYEHPFHRRIYADTRPFWKAHNNLPKIWKRLFLG